MRSGGGRRPARAGAADFPPYTPRKRCEIRPGDSANSLLGRCEGKPQDKRLMESDSSKIIYAYSYVYIWCGSSMCGDWGVNEPVHSDILSLP